MSASISIRLKNPATDDFEVRTFWVCARASRYGYVYDTTDRPGTTGRQVSDDLSFMGDMMMCHDSEEALRRAIRAAQRRRLAAWRRYSRS